MSTTPRDIIKESLRLLKVLSSGETPSADEQADGLISFNDMLDSWSNEGLFLFGRDSQTFPLVVGQQQYTMGPTGDFDTTRPMSIEDALIEDASTPPNQLPLAIVNQDQWANISVKTMQSSMPTMLFIQDTYPLLQLNFWPVPNEARNVVLWTAEALTTFTSVDTAISLPPGYKRALKFNLALELAPEYGVQPDVATAAAALEGKELIKRKNIKPRYMGTDPGVQQRRRAFNILTGV